MGTLSATSFIGWGKLQDRMFEPFDTTAAQVVSNLLSDAESRFAELEEGKKARAVSAFVFYFAWQGLADARDLVPANERQGGRTEQFTETQLAGYRSKAAEAKAMLEPYLPELKGEAAQYDFGALYGGADIPPAFTRYTCDDALRPLNLWDYSARPTD